MAIAVLGIVLLILGGELILRFFLRRQRRKRKKKAAPCPKKPPAKKPVDSAPREDFADQFLKKVLLFVVLLVVVWTQLALTLWLSFVSYLAFEEGARVFGLILIFKVGVINLVLITVDFFLIRALFRRGE
mgnify:CR=1 FL=1